MQIFSNLKINVKMLLGFGLIILLALILSLISIVSLTVIDNSYTNLMDYAEVRYQCMMEASLNYEHSRRTLLRTALMSSNDNKADAELSYKSTIDFVDKFYDAIDEYKNMVNMDPDLTDEEKNERTQMADHIINTIETEYMDIATAIYRYALAGDTDKAIEMINNTTETAASIEADISTLRDSARNTLDAVSMDSSRLVDKITLYIAALTVIITLSSIIISLRIANSIKKPLHYLGQCANEVANGNLDIMIRSNQKDEIGILTNDIGKVVDVIKQLMQNIDEMSMALDAGNIDAVIDSRAFDGYYKDVADKISLTVSTLIKEFLDVIDCVKGYAEGDFDRNVKRFPGRKAIINDTMDAVQNNLRTINLEIIKLIHSASEGKLDIRIDSSEFMGGWKDIVDGLNNLLSVVNKPITEVCEVLEEVSKANLQVRVEHNYKGEFDKMKTALNQTIENTAYYIHDISDILVEISNQNLNVSVNKEYIGEFSLIKSSLQHIIDKFNMLIGDIYSSTEYVSAGSDQISQTSIMLAQGSTEQAGAVEEILATASMIAQQATENAKNAEKVKSLTESTKTNSLLSKTEMIKMTEAMADISSSADSISKIIKTVEDIAFQTNLLALNAAVEASRAGQHGSGFSVVAEEVRNLASRSQAAAKETNALIQTSISKVAEGTKITDITSNSINIIINQIDEIHHLILDVAKASEEQNMAVGQINVGISQVAEVTQTNTATSEQAAASSQELASQAVLLKDAIAQFSLKNKTF